MSTVGDRRGPAGVAAAERAAELYLDLLKKTLTRSILPDPRYVQVPVRPGRLPHQRLSAALVRRRLRSSGAQLVRPVPHDPDRRAVGRDWPETAETMIGTARLDNLQALVADVLRRGVPGDLIETGVWRGGACILLRAVLEAYGDAERRVWVADSFRGLPEPDPEVYPADRGDRHSTREELAIPVEEVRANFERYGLLDDRVRFLEGWFEDTLPHAPIERLAVLRLDGDMYGSTIQALDALYPKLSVGGYVIVDDYGELAAARQATDDYRARTGIADPIHWVDHSGVYWQRTG